MVTYEQVKQNPAVHIYIRRAHQNLQALGYTEHGLAHVTHVAETAGYILETLDYPARQVELVKIAAYLHDIGNLVSRVEHSQSGAVMAFRLLDEMGMDPEELAEVVTAIGNHDEGVGVPVTPIAAALILADKSDVRRSRVLNKDAGNMDIHDRVNYSVRSSVVKINTAKTRIKLKLDIDTHFSPVIDFFEIFLERMMLCRRAAQTLGLDFKLIINEQQLI